MQARWGCSRAGGARKALPRDLAALADFYATTTGTPRRPGCPFEQLYRSDAWTREILDTDALMERCKGGLSWREITGRSPHVWDVRGLRVLVRARADVAASDDAERERERAQRDAGRR